MSVGVYLLSCMQCIIEYFVLIQKHFKWIWIPRNNFFKRKSTIHLNNVNASDCYICSSNSSKCCISKISEFSIGHTELSKILILFVLFSYFCCLLRHWNRDGSVNTRTTLFIRSTSLGNRVKHNKCHHPSGVIIAATIREPPTKSVQSKYSTTRTRKIGAPRSLHIRTFTY